MKNSELLVIIPAYNEEGNIERVVSNLLENYPQYDYVIINDGSSDRTLNICKDNNYSVIDLPINLGLAGGFQVGAKYADKLGYKYMIQFDADGQHLPEYIEPMIKKIEEGFDIVIASRFVTEKKPFNMRMIGSRLISSAIRLTTREQINDPTSGMRLFNSKVIKEFANEINYGPEPDTLSFLVKSGAKVVEVQAKMKERVAGTSYLNFTKSIVYMARMLTSILIIQNFRKRK